MLSDPQASPFRGVLPQSRSPTSNIPSSSPGIKPRLLFHQGGPFRGEVRHAASRTPARLEQETQTSASSASPAAGSSAPQGLSTSLQPRPGQSGPMERLRRSRASQRLQRRRSADTRPYPCLRRAHPRGLALPRAEIITAQCHSSGHLPALGLSSPRRWSQSPCPETGST